MSKKVFFFDMDGILFDSMPNHAIAWETVMLRHGLPFTAEDVYINEGRTGASVIDEAWMKYKGCHGSREEVEAIYAEKSAFFQAMGDSHPVPGVSDVLAYLRSQGALIFVVTGSGQRSLLEHLQSVFPDTFDQERMVTAFDVKHGKPDPEPYLMGFEKARAIDPSINKDDCVVIENAPLGTRAGRKAGMDVFVVNTGPLAPQLFQAEDATRIFANMAQLLDFLKQDNSI